MKKIVFLLSYIPAPLTWKRIHILRKKWDVGYVCWNKNSGLYQDKNEKNGYVIQIPASPTEPTKRVWETCLFAVKALSKLKELKPDCIYTGNLDMLFIVWLYSLFHKCHIVYEIADVHNLLMEKQSRLHLKILQTVLYHLEKLCCKKVDLLVLTSEKFYDCYYARMIPKNRVFIFHNVPSPEPFRAYKKVTHPQFTVGFIGVIRFVPQLKMLVDAAGKAGVSVMFAGGGLDSREEQEIRDYCMGKTYVNFMGAYHYDEEIAGLYQMCDCIYSVYDTSLKDIRIALPNKLYESILCGLPIIVARGTYLERVVKKWNVGVSVSSTDERELTEALRRLKMDCDFYNSLVESCRKKRSRITLSTYNAGLTKRVERIMDQALV